MKYSIIHINNRAEECINHNKNILKNFEYVNDIEYFDGTLNNGYDLLNSWGIALNVWNPYDGRSFSALPGEYGIWISTINALSYVVNNKIDNFLLLEDDVLLDNNFVKILNTYMKDLPSNYDFLSLYYFEGQNSITEKTDIGSKYIHKSYNQYSAGQAMLYSYQGAKKILKLVKRKGIEYTSDCFIYRQSLEGMINGYSITPNADKLLVHKYQDIASTIDPENSRFVEM